MNLDLEIEEIIRDLDEQMGWDAQHEDRGLFIQYIRWGWIQGYVACKDDLDAAAMKLVREPNFYRPST